MTRIAAIFLVLFAVVVGVFIFWRLDRVDNPTGYTGSVSCRQCHEEFYKLWATSHHGLAMQPYTSDFAAKELEPLAEPISIGEYQYTVEIGPTSGRVRQTGPNETGPASGLAAFL